MKNVKTILVVDDEPDLRDILQTDLEEAGYRVILAESGNAAIALLNQEKVDIIVSDMRMPNGSGLDLLDHVRGLDPVAPPFLLVTGFSDVAPEEIYSRGAGAVLTKPWAVKDLLEKVNRLLTAPHSRWKRSTDRFDKNLTVELKCADFSEGISAGVINLGRGGMFVGLDRDPPALGERVRFSFQTPSGVVVAGVGIVRWVRKEKHGGLRPGIGLEFTEIPDEQLAGLVELLAALQSHAHIPAT